MNLIELQRALTQLRLGGIAAVLETRLGQAQAESMPPIDVISCLVFDELTRRSDRLLEFTKNRNRLLEGDVAREFLCEVVNQAREKDLTSDEHFSVDGTLIEAWASLKSFQRKMCVNPECIAIFTICVSCDRGQRYCGEQCREANRRRQRSAANGRYQ